MPLKYNHAETISQVGIWYFARRYRVDYQMIKRKGQRSRVVST